MQKIFLDILARLEPEIKPEGQFQQSQTGRSEDFSPQKSPQKSWENFPAPHRRTRRSALRSSASLSPKTGRVVPCDACGQVWVSGGCCIGCGVQRVAAEEAGLEAIGSPQLGREKRGGTRLSQRSPQPKPENFTFQKHQKPQISSIPGTSPKQRDRYRVICGGEVLGERLTIDQALALAKRGVRADG